MTERARDQLPGPWSEGAVRYDAAFAPITGSFADEALDHLGVGPGVRLIDVAAGTGAATLRSARRGASVLSTDFAPGMVDMVRQRADEEGLGNRVETAVMDGQALDVVDGSFDTSISMFGVIFFPDIDAGLRELARVVRPGGRGAVGTWWLDGFRLLDVVTAAMKRIVPDAPERGPVPWAELGRPEGLTAAMTRAGFDEVTVHTVTRRMRLEDPARFFIDMFDWSPPAQTMREALPADRLDVAAGAFTEVFAEIEERHGGDGIPTTVLVGVGQTG